MKRSNSERKTEPMSIYDSMRSMIEAAKSGDLEAQHNVGACYATGDWDGPKDETEAVKWYRSAAESGHALSQYDLGFMLLLGEGINKDIEKGLWWMEQAAKNGNASAARLLSETYQNGVFEVEADAEKAKYWEEKYAQLEDGI